MAVSINVLPSFAKFGTPAEKSLIADSLPEIMSYAQQLNAEVVRIAKYKFGKQGRIAMMQFTTKTGWLIANRALDSVLNGTQTSSPVYPIPMAKKTTKNTSTSTAVRITSAPTFERYGNKVEEFAIEQSISTIQSYAQRLGADRVFVTKNLTNGKRPLMLKFMNKSTFVKNNSLNTVLSA
jgi:hypothetical protein